MGPKRAKGCRPITQHEINLLNKHSNQETIYNGASIQNTTNKLYVVLF